MKGIKERIRCKSFWASLVGAVMLILSAFGVEMGDATSATVINSICSALTFMGIFVTPDPESEREVEDNI